MDIAPRESAHHLFRFLVESIARSRVRSEDRNGNDVTHRRNSGDEYLARMSAGVEEVIFVLLPRSDVSGESVCGAIGLGCAALFSAAGKSRRDGECHQG